MSEQIREAVARVQRHLSESADVVPSADAPVEVTWLDGLRFQATDRDGRVLITDMPRGIGGGASAMTPGALMRSAIGTCCASVVALVAASRGVELDRLEVTVASTSDDRGMFGIAEVGPEPLQVQLTYRLSSPTASDAQLRAIVEEAECRSPVGQTVRREIEVVTSVERCPSGSARARGQSTG